MMTYSKSGGWPLMPLAGGAIHPAILPGSYTGCISSALRARSSSVGSHSPRPEAKSSAARGELAVPSRKSALAILHEGVAQDRVHRAAQRDPLDRAARQAQLVFALQ